MTDQSVEDDIAFIRRTVEGGRAFARGRSADLLVWGLFIAAGYLATYAYVRGWITLAPGWIWMAATGVPWIYSLRRAGARLLGLPLSPRSKSPMATALSMLWLGCGIFIMTLVFAGAWNGAVHFVGFDAVVAGIMGIAFFAGSFLCNLVWMRAVAIAWWIGEFLLYGLRGPGVLLAGAAMMVLLLALPGLVLLAGRRWPA